MISMPKRIIFIGLFFIAIIFGYYFFWHKSNAQNHEENIPITALSFDKVNAGNTVDKTDIAKPVEQPAKDKVLSVYGTAKDEAEVKKWCSTRGSMCALDRQDEKVYESYSIATLESLANNGDMRAMIHLAERYAKDFVEKGEADKGLELRNELYFKAAIYGSTDALFKLGLAAYSGSLHLPLQGQEKILEPLAYYEVASMRGDRFGELLLGDLPIKENNLTLTDADNAYIETRAEEIYQDLQRKRRELGLGEFDNDIPESVQRYFDAISN